MPSPPFEILYEDDALIFVNKAPGIVVQRGYDPDEPVLLELVAEYLAPKGERPFLLQRLDRGTSGVIFFSKSEAANPKLTRQFETKEILKDYAALCEGKVEDEREIDAPIARVGPISFGVRPDGKRAVTRVVPLAWNERASLLRIALLTGRTHQIRVHLSSVGHPLVGDWLYGRRNASRPMLHALTLSMRHPLRREQLQIVAPLPADFLKETASRQLIVPEGIPTSVSA